MGNSKFKIVAETMAEYDASQFHLRSLNCILSLDGKQAQSVYALHNLSGKTKVEQHLAIIDHFFETLNLKSEKIQKAQSDNNDKFKTLLECAQKQIETQITQSQQIFEQVTNNFLERITVAQHSAPITNHDNEVQNSLLRRWWRSQPEVASRFLSKITGTPTLRARQCDGIPARIMVLKNSMLIAIVWSSPVSTEFANKNMCFRLSTTLEIIETNG
jgi:hypothetical protein